MQVVEHLAHLGFMLAVRELRHQLMALVVLGIVLALGHLLDQALLVQQVLDARERARQLEIRALEKLRRELQPLADEVGWPTGVLGDSDAA